MVYSVQIPIEVIFINNSAPKLITGVTTTELDEEVLFYRCEQRHVC